MNQVNRRNFLRLAGAGAAAAAAAPVAQAMGTTTPQPAMQQGKPDTNIADAVKVPRNEHSMPGLFPGRVALVKSSSSVKENTIIEQEVYDMIARSMLELTGEKKLKKAWRRFVAPGERIGLKVNPVAGKSLSTSHEVVRSVIAQLELSGIERSQLTIWDRREFELTDVGFTAENYPGY
ncbi:MAG: twin-arginine translocation signal domain-containing protein [Bacteroidales bacterium]|nr:twin-arginine translocation signal domain-containing protein [Bacteroidales bacterium]